MVPSFGEKEISRFAEAIMERVHIQLACLMIPFLCVNAIAILKPGFEYAIYDPITDLNRPVDWSYENYANVVSSYTPVTERGKILDWSIDAPCEGNSFLVLTTGSVGSTPESAISYAKVYQETTFHVGEELSFNWFFGTSDYRPYYDYGLASLVPVNPADNLNVIDLVRISVNDVGDFGSTNGWQYTSFTFNTANAGRYNLVFEVHDGTDVVYESFFAVDNIIPEPASLLLLGLGGLALMKRRV
jgi:hypothetical protein